MFKIKLILLSILLVKSDIDLRGSSVNLNLQNASTYFLFLVNENKFSLISSDTTIFKKRKNKTFSIESEYSNISYWNIQDNLHFEGLTDWNLVNIITYDKSESFKMPKNTTLDSCFYSNSKYILPDNIQPIKINLINDANLLKLLKNKLVKVSLKFHIFDRWENDVFYIKYQNNLVFSEKFNYCEDISIQTCLQKKKDICYDSYPDYINQNAEFNINIKDDVMIEIGSSLKDFKKAKFGIGNILIYINN